MAQEPSDQPSKTEQPSELTSSMASMEPLTPISLPRSTRASSTRASIWSPIFQSVTLLGTMVAMLALARYTVPSVVEEIRYAWHRGQMRAEYETGDEGLKNVSLDSLSRAYEMVTSAVGPSVVHIDVQRGPTNNPTDPLRRFLRQKFGGDESSDDSASRDRTSPQGNTNPDGSMGPGSDVDPALRFSVPPRSGSDRSDLFTIADQGSGVIVDGDGHILTNRHVISEGRAIWVTLSDGRRVEARVVGTDRLTDLAVLKVEADGLLPIRWGDSSSIRVGSPVWAVGSPFGLDRTITFGILSGKHRMVRAGARYGASARYQDFMQSDVAVNPGNSGGPLVDARGRLIGINTAIVGETYQGVSFSIPSDVSRTIYQRIRDNG
ncbi:MAG: trypsin-like peptidase domain-containing protein, partial [Planctomycetota bacterium]